MHSWGYLKDRCHHLGLNLNSELSRIISENQQIFNNDNEITISEIKIKGRIVLDVWRLLRHEVNIILKMLKLVLNKFNILVSGSELHI